MYWACVKIRSINLLYEIYLIPLTDSNDRVWEDKDWQNTVSGEKDLEQNYIYTIHNTHSVKFDNFVLWFQSDLSHGIYGSCDWQQVSRATAISFSLINIHLYVYTYNMDVLTAFKLKILTFVHL